MLLAALLALHDPVATFSVSPDSGPPPLAIAVDASASSSAHGALVGYAWDWGDGSPAGAGVSTSHVYAATGTYTIRLTVTDAEGFRASSERSVDVLSASNARPSASASATATQGDAPFSTTFSGAGTDPGDVLELRWDFGDGSPAVVFGGLASGETTSPAHTYAAPGVYTCVLRVTDAEGVRALASVQIVVSAAGRPSAAFAAPERVAPSASLEVDATTSFDPGGGPLVYRWDWGDGTTSNGGPLASHAYAATGTFAITLTVEDVDGLLAQTTREIHCLTPTNTPPGAHLQGAVPASGVAPLRVTFVGHGHDDAAPLAHRWDFGDGTPAAVYTSVANHENTRPEHVYVHPGTYVCELRVLDTENVAAARTVAVTVLAAESPLGDRCGATGLEVLLLLWARKRRRVRVAPVVVALLLAAAVDLQAQVTCAGCADRVLPANATEAGGTSARLSLSFVGGDRAFSGDREALSPPPAADIEWSRTLGVLDVYHQFTPKIGAGVALPFYEQSIENRATGVDSDVMGIGDLGLYAVWAPWREEVEPADFLSAENLSVMLAMSVPTGDELDNEVPALHNYHLGSGSVEFKILARYDGRLSDAFSLYAAGALTIDGGPDSSGFRYGNGYDGQLGVVARPWTELRLMAAVDVVRREQDRLSGVELPDSGGTWSFAILGVAWAYSPSFILEATAGIPLRRNVKGTQPVSEELWSLGVTVRF